MTDKPILFSAPMVLALLDGQKTQTRRILKLQPLNPFFDDYSGDDSEWCWREWYEVGREPCGAATREVTPQIKLPYAIGDRLWVRETFAEVGEQGWLLYRADGYESECARHGFDKPYPAEKLVKWKSPIFMARALSRLTLTVTGVKIQRLQDINEEDAIEEGVELDRCCGSPHREGFPSGSCCGQPDMTDPVEEYRTLWNNINGPDAWDANPWVVALTFDLHRGNIDGVAT